MYEYAILVLLGFAAYFDWKYREVPDFFTSLICLVFSFYGDFGMIRLAFMGISLMYFINLFKKMWGWADVLLMPIVFSFFTLSPIASIIALPILIVSYLHWKEKIPYLVPLFFILLSIMIFRMIQ